MKPKSMSKSMLAAKSFESTDSLDQIQQWAEILSEELAERLKKDETVHNRKPRNLVLHYRLDPRRSSTPYSCDLRDDARSLL